MCPSRFGWLDDVSTWVYEFHVFRLLPAIKLRESSRYIPVGLMYRLTSVINSRSARTKRHIFGLIDINGMINC